MAAEAIGRALFIAGASLTFGAALYRLLVDREAAREAAVAGAWIAFIGGLGDFRTTALGLLLLLSLFALRRRHPAGPAVTAGVGAWAVLTAALSGHAASATPYPILGAVFAGVHAIAAAAWAGALATLALTVGRSQVDVQRIGRRFGDLAAWALGAAVLSGVVLSFGLLGSLANLTATGYGRVLLLKLGLLVVAVALAAGNRFRTVPAADRRALARNVSVEALFALGVLAAAGWLAATPTPPA